MKPDIKQGTKLDSRQTEAFVSYLQEELARRCAANSRYSLRAFARKLAVDPSNLSKILQGKRTLTQAGVRSFAMDLDLSSEKLEEILSSPRSPKNEKLNFNQISMDAIHLVADWYHFAILELLDIESFRPDIGWVSRVLGVSRMGVKVAVDRLVRLDLLEISKSGAWKATSANTTTLGSAQTAPALRRNQRQLLERAIEALEACDPDRRDHSALTFSLAVQDLPLLKEKLRAFRREISTAVQKAGKKQDVYALSFSLFPLTKPGLQETKRKSHAKKYHQ